MAFEHKAGTFTLWKNDRKESNNHPDYKGQGKDLDGNDVWVSSWIKTTENGGKFMSCSMQLKQAHPAERKPGANVPAAEYEDDTGEPF